MRRCGSSHMKVPQILCVMLLCTALASEAAEAAPVQPGGSVTADPANEGGPNEAQPSHAARSRTVPAEDASKKAERADQRQSPRAGPDKSVGSTGGNPGAAASRGRESAATQRGVGQLVRPNADRLRALLNAQARGRPARQPSRGSVGPGRAATDGRAAVPGRGGMGQESRPTPATSGRTAVASGPTAVAAGPATVAAGSAAAAAGPTAVASRLAPVISNSAVRPVTAPNAVTRAIGRGTAIGGPRAPGVAVVGGPAAGRTVHSAMVDGTQFRHGH